MGAKAKKAKQEYRQKMKKARKETEKARYASYRDAGTNKKSKRDRLKSAREKGVKTVRHAVLNCGNQGCERCAPDLARPRMNDSNDPRVRFRTREQQKKDGVFK